MKDNLYISIIIPVKNEGENIKHTLESLFYVKTNCSFEVIIVNDKSDDNCCAFLQNSFLNKNIKLLNTTGVGAANARNIGAKKALGEIFVFCDAHLIFEDYWLDLLLESLLESQTDAVTPAIGEIGNGKFIGYGQTLRIHPDSSNIQVHWNRKTKYMIETPILPGGCFMIKKTVFEVIGGFDSDFQHSGFEDVEFSIKLWLFGYNCKVQPHTKVLHLFRKKQPYQMNIHHYYYNLIWLSYLHFNFERIKKIQKMITYQNLDDLITQVLINEVLLKKKSYTKKRKYTDDWYFKKFKINF
ncbi:MAG: glycosyltransferase [Bacillus sp. (in: firmicutes)]|uniref:glycosyltransferase family 2 protein n=1 Tax=Bacillus sp. TaxID=1409 RepID=UPI0039E5E7ED